MCVCLSFCLSVSVCESVHVSVSVSACVCVCVSACICFLRTYHKSVSMVFDLSSIPGSSLSLRSTSAGLRKTMLLITTLVHVNEAYKLAAPVVMHIYIELLGKTEIPLISVEYVK